MDSQRYEELHTLFHKALTLPDALRRTFLETACEGDDQLLEDVLSLLEADEESASILNRELSQMALGLFEGSQLHPDTIGSYRILKVLGKGGMGIVYLAKHRELDRKVALKVLRDAQLSPARRKRFEMEKKLLAQLDHHNIARLYVADALPDGTPYFIMEYVDGMPLTEYCNENNLDLKQRIQLFLSVCEVVNYAHRQAVIHRDLKPSNILVTADGTVKLLDFGIARQIDVLEENPLQTETIFQMMTPAYAAPEQLKGESAGVHTDVYSLGVLFFELLCGELPFDSRNLTPGQFEQLVLHQDPEKVSVKYFGLSPEMKRFANVSKSSWSELDIICLKAMHRDVQRRYLTVESLIRDIRHFLNNEPLEARPDSFVYRLNKFVKRNREMVTGLSLIFLLIIGMVTYYTSQLAKERAFAQSEAEKANMVSEYLVGLFESGDPFTAGADNVDIYDLLKRGADRAEELSDKPEVQAQMFNVLGRVYINLSDFNMAGSLLNRSLKIRREIDEKSIETAESLGNLGLLHRYNGQLDSAEVFFREALEIRVQYLPDDHPDIATTLDNLGVVLTNQGKYEEGETIYREALDIRRRIYREPDVLLAHSLNNLAVNLANQGNYSEAEQLLHESIQVASEVLGPDHVSIASDLSNLGVLLDITGKYEAADSVLTEALRIKQLNLGDYHFETSLSMMQLGGVLQRAGKLDRAESVLSRALEINEQILDPNHRYIAVTHTNLAGIYQQRGDYDRAGVNYEKAVEILHASYGDQHEFTATTQCHLAHLHHLTGNLRNAELQFDKCMEVLEQQLAPNHDILAGFQSKYGSLLTAISRYDEAETFLLNGYQILNSVFGPEHRDTQEALHRLVELYEKTGEAEKIAKIEMEMESGR
ncbi:MAG: tetratricopeptide repeat protein [Balneolaceae bacterium]